MPACKIQFVVLIPVPQRVFEVAPLVPGSPSLDGKPHSPGGTRRLGILDFRFAIADLFLSRLSEIRNPQSEIQLCQSVTVVLRCRKLSSKTRALLQKTT